MIRLNPNDEADVAALASALGVGDPGAPAGYMAEARRILTALPANPAPLIDRERHPESFCHRCGGPNVSWHAPSPLWNAVMRRDGADDWNGIVCPTCFAALLVTAGIATHFRVDATDVAVELATTDADGRVWDPSVDLWVERAKP